MAQPRDRQAVARPVCMRFEPSHLAQACVEDAYARLVSLRRQGRLPLRRPECPGSLDAVVGSRHIPSFERQQQEEAQRCS
jgi:hypothetical protein